MENAPAPHSWKFFRTGGLDQVALETAADLQRLAELDPKLWVALSCPVKGLELDEKTLALIDTDGDGRIRVPELLAAVQWASARLKDPAALLQGAAALPLAGINDATPDGQALLGSARRILANLGQSAAAAITPADTGDTAKIFASSAVNGDGVIPPDATDDAAVQALIKDILATVGGAADRTGAQGVTSEKVDEFFAAIAAYLDWIGQSSAKEIAVLGEHTEAAVGAIRTVRAKVEDYFARCRLAAFDARAIGALNRAEADYLAVAAKDMKIGAEEVAGFPLARIAPAQPLPLLVGVNPAWAAALATLHRAAVAPLHGTGKTALTEEEWSALTAQFAGYETWLGTKGGSAVEKLGLARLKEILAGDGRAKLTELVAKDRALEPQFKALSDVDRLARYHRDLRALLHNFVNFADFYSRDRWAIFQAGTLYLDSRSTELCVRVDGPSPLAAMSKTYIAYCTCTRQGKTMAIAACFTQGDSDYLFVGRHGVFWDRAGNDWDAVITSIVDNPISISQAFWSPYKKFIRMIEEQVAKRAAAAESASSAKLATAAEQTANVDKNAPAHGAPPKKIDVGTVAALGVAAGAIMGALGAIATGLAKLAPWQLPLVLVGVMLVISLPSMAIAWLKLRQRTLGPLLEANGWAVNGRVKINIPFGSALTEMAKKPAGSRVSLEDPYEDKAAARRKRLTVFWCAFLLAAGAAIWIRWDATKHADENGHARYFWQDRPAPAAPAQPAAAAEAPKT
ncbi:MAG: hypothetical protein KF715_16625 [Candidatus Didemnitutus sp.]|nr:hypothetical protein [Candidatus Didemnitutus sp.]